MTVDAPAHVQGLGLAYALHRLDRAVALLALHSGADVGAMIEIDEVGDLMNARPADTMSHCPDEIAVSIAARVRKPPTQITGMRKRALNFRV